MLASPQEALDILKKWFDESTRVTALLVSPDSLVTVKVTGFVNGVTSRILISDGSHDKTVIPKNFLLVPIEFISSFQYIEARELGLSPEEQEQLTEKFGTASLSLIYQSEVRLSIFEHPPGV